MKLSTLILTASIALFASSSAFADHHSYRHHHGHKAGYVLGGLVAGALIGSALTNSNRRETVYVDNYAAPVAYVEEYCDVPVSVQRRYRDRWGRVHYYYRTQYERRPCDRY